MNIYSTSSDPIIYSKSNTVYTNAS